MWDGYNEYDDEAGFLTGFSAQMLAAILNTTLTVAKASVDGGGSETVTDKVFLLSKAEVGLGAENGVSEGSTLAMFSDNSSRQCRPTAQAVSNSEYKTSSLSASQYWYYYLRSPARVVLVHRPPRVLGRGAQPPPQRVLRRQRRPPGFESVIFNLGI